MSSVGKYIRLLNSAGAVAELQTFFGLEKINEKFSDTASPHVSECSLNNGHVEVKNGGTPAATTKAYQRNNGDCQKLKNAASDDVDEYTKLDDLDPVIIKNKLWYYLFCFGAELGNKYFYLVFYPFFMWNFSPWLLRRAIYVWVVTMYFGQAAKEVIKMPRPSCPPAIKMERRYETEYGMPSTHAMVGLIMPFTLLLASIGRFEYPLILGLCVAIFWTSIVVMSRMYLGMHSLLDVIAGITSATIMMTLMFPFLDLIDDWVLHRMVTPFIVLLLILISTIMFPRSKKWRETHADTLNITSIAGGIAIGSWVNCNTGLFVPYTGPLPYVLTLPTLSMVAVMVLRMAAGVPLLIVLDEVLTFCIRNTMAALLGVPLNKKTKRLPLIELPHRFGAYFTMTLVCVTVSPLTFQYLGLDQTGPYMDL